MGCRVTANRHGRLALRLTWNGNRSWEGTGLADTKANRQKLQRLADAVAAEIRLRQFTVARYLHYFPNGNRVSVVAPEPQPPAASSPMTLKEYYDEWIARQVPPLVRAALQRDYRQHVEHYVLPSLTKDGRTFGSLCIADLKPTHLLKLRERLLNRGLALKTVRNIMDGSFRAMIRDARTIDLLIPADPFAALTWPRLPLPKPDPFSVAERDRIVAWFLEHKRFYFPFIFTLFHTGMRPSEAAALRWGDVDTAAGRLTISRSRYLGNEAATKTSGSQRTIRLLPDVCAVLRNSKPLHIDADKYVFTNAKNGGPIEQREWPRDHWGRVLRGLEIRPRKFYATRHTFISVGLTAGVNLKWLAEYCGTSVAMIESHYGRYLERDGERELQLLMGSDAEQVAERKVATRQAKMATLGAGSPFSAEKPSWNKASPTGFEPEDSEGNAVVST